MLVIDFETCQKSTGFRFVRSHPPEYGLFLSNETSTSDRYIVIKTLCIGNQVGKLAKIDRIILYLLDLEIIYIYILFSYGSNNFTKCEYFIPVTKLYNRKTGKQLFTSNSICLHLFAPVCTCLYLFVPVMQQWQWSLGTVAIFLCWINLVLFLQKFPRFGIYVVMFKDILNTFLQFAFVFFLFIVAFGLGFFTILQNQASLFICLSVCPSVCLFVCVSLSLS